MESIDHGRPFFHFGRKQSGQLFRRRADGHHADVVEVCPDRWIAQGGDRINVDFVDDRWRCPPRNEEREPSRHVETGHAPSPTPGSSRPNSLPLPPPTPNPPPSPP